MARLGRRMSENDVLIEMRRLRGEIAEVRTRMDRPARASSFAHRRPRAGQLRDRVGAAMLVAIAIVVGLLCWSLYRLLEATVGSFLQDLLPQPIRTTAAILFEMVALLV